MSKKSRRDSNNQEYNSREKKRFHQKDILQIQPKTDTQKLLFHHWKQGQKHLYLHGAAGTGKTFCALFLALNDLLNKDSFYDKIVIVRSIVPCRDIGFLPGDLTEKIEIYERPYKDICDQLFSWQNSYENLKKLNYIEFESTSFLRGITLDNAIIIVDEFQNMTFSELDTIITRVGLNSKIVFCGDKAQTDLSKTNGWSQFSSIISKMKNDFEQISFTSDDIIRNQLVKKYIILRDSYIN